MARINPDMTGRTHGVTGYNYGCRCDICRADKALKRKEYQSSKAWEYTRTYRERLRINNPEKFEELKRRNNEIKKRNRNPETSRWQTIYKKYKLTKPMYEALMVEQNNVCAICKRSPNRNYLAVDHDHSCCPGMNSCGKCVRGLLCGSCNSFLGRVNDNADSLIAYLNTYAESR